MSQRRPTGFEDADERFRVEVVKVDPDCDGVRADLERNGVVGEVLWVSDFELTEKAVAHAIAESVPAVGAVAQVQPTECWTRGRDPREKQFLERALYRESMYSVAGSSA